MKTKEIIKALTQKGVTQAEIADELGVRPSTVNQVIHKRQTSRRIQNLVADKINLPFDAVWDIATREKNGSREVV